MSLQSTVNIEQGFGVEGSFFDASPRRTIAMLVSGGDDVAAVAATATVTMAGDVADDGDTLTIGGQVYTFKTTMAAAYDVQIGGTIAATMTSLGLAINGTGTAGTDYFAGTVANLSVTSSAPTAGAITLTAIYAGLSGNSILISKVCTEITLSGAALSGGAAAIDVSAAIGRAFTYDATDRNVALVGTPASGTFAGILVNPKTQTHTGLDATLTVADGSQGDICSMGHIIVKPLNSASVGYSAYFDDLTGEIYAYSGVGAQSGKTLITGSQFIRVDSTAPSGLAVLSITNA